MLVDIQVMDAVQLHPYVARRAALYRRKMETDSDWDDWKAIAKARSLDRLEALLRDRDAVILGPRTKHVRLVLPKLGWRLDAETAIGLSLWLPPEGPQGK